MTKALFVAAALLALSAFTFGQSAEKPKLSGKWHFVLHTDGGDRENDSTLEVTADKVSGKWDVGNEPSPIKGIYTEGDLVLEVALASSQIGPGTMKIKARAADDNSLTGDWAFQDYSGTLDAKRVKEPAK